MPQTSKTKKVKKFISAHNHLREGKLLHWVVRAERFYSYLVAMGNLAIATSTSGLVLDYVFNIIGAGAKFVALPNQKKTKNTTVDTISEVARYGYIKAVKFLPANTSTGSEKGISFFDLLSSHGRKLLAEIERGNLLFLIHAELIRDKNGKLIDPRERSLMAIPFLKIIAKDFPNLRIVIEHANDRATIEFVRKARKNVWATLRPQDTMLTYDDVYDKTGKFHPLNYALPIAKSLDDALAVHEAMVGGEDKFFYGPDSAPWLLEDKLKGKAGIFIPSKYAIPLVVEIFEKAKAINHLQKFTVDIARELYGLHEVIEELTLIAESQVVPHSYHGIPLFMAGETLKYKIIE